ncbi:Uncharacterised protein [Vibrio cholerae]|uniref:Uncharacterized protein n=1 Tax=Vibrio cholerae TaxID=666 RepID=A0A655ZKZ8_VIBCL|nr:Uncharacterised protein [Vibrio cholerae]
MNRNIALRIKGINDKTVPRIDRFFFCKIKQHQILVNLTTALDLLFKQGFMFTVQVYPFFHIWQLQDFVNRCVSAVINQCHH